MLFDYFNGPRELDNLAEKEEYKEILTQLAEK